MNSGEEKISELSERFLQTMSELGISGYRLKQDGVINSEPTLTKIKRGIQEPSKKTIDLFCEKYVKHGYMRVTELYIKRDFSPVNEANYKLMEYVFGKVEGGE